MQHHFDTEVAEKYGIPCAVIFQWMLYWVEYNRANDTNFHDGRYWVYNSNKALQELFPYMGWKQLRAALKKLTDEKMIVTGCYNAVSFDRTLWYSLGDAGLSYLPKCTDDSSRKSAHGYAGNGHISSAENGHISSAENGTTNTIIRTLEEHYKKIEGEDTGAKEPKGTFGELGNVHLTDDEYEKLLVKMGDIGREKYIEAVSLYKGKTGRTYKSDYAACLAYWQKDGRPVEKSAKIVELRIDPPDLSTPEAIREAIWT